MEDEGDLSQDRFLTYERMYQKWLHDVFQAADKNNSGTLHFKECFRLLELMNVQVSYHHLKTVFAIANSNKRTEEGSQVLNWNEFISFSRLVIRRRELEDLFYDYSQKRDCLMTDVDLIEFFNVEQYSRVSLKKAMELINKFEPSSAKDDGFLTYLGFCSMLSSGLFNLIPCKMGAVYQDMDQPLKDYYIATSHQTYLSRSTPKKCSTEAYAQALEEGCRYLDISLWDGTRGEPVVAENDDSGSWIQASEVLQVIKQNAFEESPYPVFLMLKNHMSREQERRLVYLILTILGQDAIYTGSSASEMPSPNELKHKFILLTSRRKKKKKKLCHESRDQSWTQLVAASDSVQAVPERSMTERSAGGLTDQTFWIDEELVEAAGLPRTLRELTCNSVSIKSLSKARTRALIRHDAVQFSKKASRQLRHVYLKSFRHTWSESKQQKRGEKDKPLNFWNVGCQLVSVRYHKFDVSRRLNWGKFLQNGHCGYVLKPGYLRHGIKIQRLTQIRKIIRLRLISGQHLPFKRYDKSDVVDPYVVVSIHGTPLDAFTAKTKVVQNNGLNPRWNLTVEVKLRTPELDLIHFAVKDYDDNVPSSKHEILGWFCCSTTCLSQGYRYVPLLDESALPISLASIFVNITIRDIDVVDLEA